MLLYWILAASGAFVLLPLLFRLFVLRIVVPLRIRKTQSLKVTPAFEGATADDLTPELKGQLGQVLAQFSAAGFTVAANLRLRGAATKADASTLLLVNRARGEVGSIVAAQSTLNQRTFVYSVKTTFADGAAIATGVNQSVYVSTGNPRIDAVALPWAADVATVCELHRRRIKAAGRAKEQGVVPAPGNEVAYLTGEWQRNIARAVERRLRWVDADAGLARLTLLGAFVMTWRALEPIKSLLVWRRTRNAKRVWRHMGMGEWNPSANRTVEPQPQPPPAVVDDPVDSIDTSLRYRVPEGPGQVRWRWAGPVLTMTCVNGSVAEVFLSRAIEIALIVMFGPSVLFYVVLFLVVRPRHVDFISSKLVVAAVLVLVGVVWSIVNMVTEIRRAGRKVTIVARVGEIHFHNAPGRPHEGVISTSDLDRFRTVRSRRFGTSRHALAAVKRSGGSVRLLASSDRTAVESARFELAVAAGIENRPAPK